MNDDEKKQQAGIMFKKFLWISFEDLKTCPHLLTHITNKYSFLFCTRKSKGFLMMLYFGTLWKNLTSESLVKSSNKALILTYFSLMSFYWTRINKGFPALNSLESYFLLKMLKIQQLIRLIVISSFTLYVIFIKRKRYRSNLVQFRDYIESIDHPSRPCWNNRNYLCQKLFSSSTVSTSTHTH